MSTGTLPSWIRATPSLFYVLAVLDLVKNLAPLYAFIGQTRSQSIDYTSDLRPHMIVLAAFIYAAGWFAYGVLVTIALGIYDRLDGRPSKDRDFVTMQEAAE